MEWFKSMSKSIKVLLCIVILLIIIFAGRIIYKSILPVNTDESDIKLRNKLDSYMNEQVREKKFSGSILVAQKGKVLISKGYGMANYELDVPNSADTKYSIGSVTKTFTATAVMKLAEKKKLSIDDKLEKYLPDYPHGDKIRISNLLEHTSGIPDFTDFPDFMDTVRDYRTPDQLIEIFKDKPLEFEPGSKAQYSNSGYVLLAYIIEKVTGQEYEQYLKKEILEPLVMKDSGQIDTKKVLKNRASGYCILNGEIENSDYSDMSYAFGGGSLYSTVNDLYKWDRAFHSGKVLNKASINRMFTPNKDGFGFGWGISDTEIGAMKKKAIRCSGVVFGFNSQIDRYIDDDNVIIILSNFENLKNGSLVLSISNELAEILYGIK